MTVRRSGICIIPTFFHGPFLVSWKRQHKNTDTNPCQTVLRASQNHEAALNRRKILRQPCSCRPGRWAHAAKDGIRVFDWWSCFFSNLQNPFPYLWSPGHGGGKIGSLYTEIHGFPTCQSCIPARIFAIYMTDGNRIRPWSFWISFSIHLYCISTSFLQPSLKNFTLMCR